MVALCENLTLWIYNFLWKKEDKLWLWWVNVLVHKVRAGNRISNSS